MNTFRAVTAVVIAIGVLGFVAGPAVAENRFLNGTVPVQPTPEIDSNTGVFDVAQADSGEAVAFWGQGDGLFVSVRPANGTFGSPVLIVSGPSGTALPKVAMAPNGQAVITWRESVMGTDQVRSAIKPAGSATFGAPITISAEEHPVPNLDPQVDIADDGSMRFAWIGRDLANQANARIRTRALSANGLVPGSVSSISPLDVNGVTAPELAVGPTGYSMITWVDGNVGSGDLGTYYLAPGGGDPDLQLLDTNDGQPAVAAIDKNGTAVIAYQQGLNGDEVIGNYRASGPGTNFQSDQGLQLAGTNNAFSPRLEMDEDGNATVIFTAFDAGQWSIQTVDRPAGNDQFFGTTTEAIARSADVNDAALAVGPDGTAIIGWSRQDDRVYTAVRTASATQFSAQSGPVSPDGAEVGEINSTVDGQGRGLTAYSSRIAPATKFTIDALPYDDVPVANDLVIPAAAVQGEVVNFSVNPFDPWSLVTGVEWTVDPGVSKSGNAIAHTYATVGERTVSVKLTDADGNTNTFEGKIKVSAKPDTTKPKVTKFSIKLKRAKAKKKNAFRFTLSEKARVKITVKRTSKGKGKRAQGKIVKKNVAAGKRKIVFKGRIGKRKLKPAKYLATIVAVDQFGNKSKPRKLRFRIIR